MMKFWPACRSIAGCTLFSLILGGALAGLMNLPYNNTGYDEICAIIGVAFGIFVVLIGGVKCLRRVMF